MNWRERATGTAPRSSRRWQARSPRTAACGVSCWKAASCTTRPCGHTLPIIIVSTAQLQQAELILERARCCGALRQDQGAKSAECHSRRSAACKVPSRSAAPGHTPCMGRPLTAAPSQGVVQRLGQPASCVPRVPRHQHQNALRTSRGAARDTSDTRGIRGGHQQRKG